MERSRTRVQPTRGMPPGSASLGTSVRARSTGRRQPSNRGQPFPASQSGVESAHEQQQPAPVTRVQTMGLRDSGSSRLNLPRIGERTEPVDELWNAVREAAADDFAVLGEIGRGTDGTVAYLARDRADGRLVALKV